MQNKIENAINNLKVKKNNTLKEYLKLTLNKPILIYGAGVFGKEIAQVLLQNGLQIEGFLDKYKSGNLLGFPIFNPSKIQNKNVIVILAIVLNKSIREEILTYIYSLGFKNILDGQEIRAQYVKLEKGQHTYEYFEKNKDAILNPLSFLEDEESKKTYSFNLSSHISRDYSDYMESNEKEQYFIKNIDFIKNYTRFIDCGAYIGDTFLKLIKENKEVEEYVGFEPIQESFEELKNIVKKENIKSTILPFAVSNKRKTVNFNNNLGSSCIDENGNEKIECIKIDDILCNYSPSFIKMDIEGEEINALHGARDLITNSKPNLAICVYHFINHFWEIPNLLNSWQLGYKFYLRAHSSACMETVLYAIKKD